MITQSVSRRSAPRTARKQPARSRMPGSRCRAQLCLPVLLLAALGSWTASGAGAGVAEPPWPLPSLLPRRTAEPAWTEAEQARQYVVGSTTCMQPFLQYQVPARSQIRERVRCRLAQAEYEPLLIGVYVLAAADPLKDVHIEVDLDLPVSVRRVEFRDYRYAHRLPGYEDLQIPDVAMPLTDRIEHVAPGRTRTFWLTVHAPAGAEPGAHTGRIRVVPAGKPPVELDLNVDVLPFELPRAQIAFGMYSYPTSQLFQSEAYQRRVYQDMIAHGLTSVTVYDSESSWTVDPETGTGTYTFGPRGELEMRLIRETGLCSEGIPVFYTDYKVVGWHPAHRRLLGDAGTAAAAEAILDRAAARGYPPLVFQGEDEPAVDQDEDFFAWAEAWKKSRARMATAMNMAAASQFGHLYDVQIVHIGGITPELLAEARRAGNEVWSYHFSHAHSGPVANRYDTGLYTWGLGLTGSFKWVYYHQYNAYVEVTGPDIRPKPSYEALREGIDDYRYLRLLENCIRANQRSAAARRAQRWLDGLRRGTDWKFYHEGVIPGDRRYFVHPAPDMTPTDFDKIRDRAVAFITAIGVPENMPAPEPRPSSLATKFEAQPFTDKSVRECVNGLRSRNMVVRRAAAAALAARGPEAAPAVSRLIRQLRDPDVRLPAFRALQAIGPAAAKAVPVLTEQLRNPDAFVRTGAVYALGVLGKTAVPALRSALTDAEPTVVQAACRGLARIGPDAADAVPDLANMLRGAGPGSFAHIGELDASLARYIYKAIAGIGPDAAAALPILMERFMRENDPAPRREIAAAMTGVSPGTAALWQPPLGPLLWQAPAGTRLLALAPEYWRFRRDPDKLGEQQRWFDPATPKAAPDWTGLSTHDFWPDSFVGDGWYAADVFLPAAGDKRVWVHLGAVDENYTLWINGRYIGDNLDVYQRLWDVPVQAEITGKFAANAFNHLVVRATNTAQAGGIWRPVRVIVEE